MTCGAAGRSLSAIVLLACAALGSRAAAQVPWWRDSLGYGEAQLFSIRVGADGFPYLPVSINEAELWLLFDTGNMRGLAVATKQYDELALGGTGATRVRDSNGRLVGEFRVGQAQRVRLLGHSTVEAEVHEFDHPRLTGLVGPGSLPGTRFTLDYRTALMAVDSTALRDTAGAHLLVRSHRHPHLIVVRGTFRGKPVLIELDTGKSRSVVDPEWAAGAGLAVGPSDTVSIGELRIGEAVFDVTNAKPVGLAAIDPDLPAPLALSLGSDTLSRFVLTVDYRSGLVLLWAQD